MQHFVVHLRVSFKPELLDPQGKAVTNALHSLGYPNVGSVGIGKYMETPIETESEAMARSQTEEMYKKFLASPVTEEYEILSVTVQAENPPQLQRSRIKKENQTMPVVITVTEKILQAILEIQGEQLRILEKLCFESDNFILRWLSPGEMQKIKQMKEDIAQLQKEVVSMASMRT